MGIKFPYQKLWVIGISFMMLASFIFSRVLYGDWWHGGSMFTALLFGSGFVLMGICDWNTDDDDDEDEDEIRPAPSPRSRREIIIRVVLVLFGTFMLFAQIMSTREDLLKPPQAAAAAPTSPAIPPH